MTSQQILQTNVVAIVPILVPVLLTRDLANKLSTALSNGNAKDRMTTIVNKFSTTFAYISDSVHLSTIPSILLYIFNICFNIK